MTAQTKFFLYCFCILFQAIGLIQKYKTVFLWKIIKERNSIFFCGLFYSRINRDLIEIFQRALALRIKCTDRIDLISPELDSPWILFCKRIDIDNSTTNRKLSRHLYLTYALITHMNKCILEFIHIQRTVISEMDQLFFYLIKRLKIIQTSVYTGNYCDAFFLFQKCLDHTHPLTDQKIPVNICLKKEHIFCRIIIYILIIKTIIFVQFLRRFFIFRQNQMRWKKPGKPIY